MVEIDNVALKYVSVADSSVAGLIAELDKYQIDLYGLENCNLETPGSLMKNQALMLGAFIEDRLVGIGAIKFVANYAEVKRMFIKNEFRRRGLGSKILNKLEEYAKANNIENIYLETGRLHAEAISLYKKMGYHRVDQFGEYKPNPTSMYFQKKIVLVSPRMISIL